MHLKSITEVWTAESADAMSHVPSGVGRGSPPGVALRMKAVEGDIVLEVIGTCNAAPWGVGVWVGGVCVCEVTVLTE